MGPNRWRTSKTAVFNIGYHLIWCPKYRRKVLTGEVEKRLRTLIEEKAFDMNIAVESMEILPDHVHLFVKSDPSFAPQEILQQIKGYTSRMLRNEFPSLVSKLPSLWTRSYYCESVGHISEKTIMRYIEDQKNK
jgi:putative transposase